jgi:asparagine synthase (glutamine-hydrolysing)
LASPRRIDRDLLAALGRRLEHRGPDDFGWSATTNAGTLSGHEARDLDGVTTLLVHRRLSIIDLSPAGHQPMTSGDLTVVFNGEIYNHIELRAELEGLGHHFRSRSDTEVLLVAWRQWGAAALTRFVGMFAFAIRDDASGVVHLARDPFGIKPLYFMRREGSLVFASEIPALLALPGVPRRANPRTLYHYLTSGMTDHGSETLLDGIEQVLPAHYLTVRPEDPSSPAATRYFSFDREARADLDLEPAAERLRDLFLENVRLHMRSDVPVGAALSGGIDSSSIVMAIRKLFGREVELHAFSYIADDPALSEERWVDTIAAASGATVHKVRADPSELVADLEALIACQGEPFGSTSIYAQHRVFRRAREAGIKVMLDGQGADELLAGYESYLRSRLHSLLRQGRFVEAFRFVRAARERPGGRRLWTAAGKVLPAAVKAPLRWLVTRLQKESTALDARWFRARAAWPDPRSGPADRFVLRHHLHEGLTETSLPMLLRYEDRNSMHHSIESRVPFLTPAFASFVLGLREEHIVGHDGTSKLVFRRAMRGIVPDAILDRRDKIGFATPERRWLTAVEPWARRILESDVARSIPALDWPRVQAQWEGALAGRVAFDFRLWRWINLVRWTELFQVEFDRSSS